MVLKKWVKNIQTAGYNGTRLVSYFDLSYVFPVYNDSVQQDLTVAKAQISCC